MIDPQYPRDIGRDVFYLPPEVQGDPNHPFCREGRLRQIGATTSLLVCREPPYEQAVANQYCVWREQVRYCLAPKARDAPEEEKNP